jgi:Helix-turn-helix.
MIKENRIKRGFTQEEFAEMLSISWRQLQRIEKNEEKTTIVTLKKIIKMAKIPDKEVIEFMKK